MKFIISIIVNAILLWVIAMIFPKALQFDKFTTTILASLIISLCNVITFRTLLGQITVLISLLFSSILGWFGILFSLLAIETLFLYIADKILSGMSLGGFWWGMLIVICLTFINLLLFNKKK